MSLETIGVVIPTFQRPEETLRAITSVLDQTYSAARVVVIDDGSQASDARRLRDLTRHLPVDLLHIDGTRHPGRARKLAVDMLETDWVAFLDSDDVWLPTKLQFQIDAATELGAIAVCTNANRIIDGINSGPYHGTRDQIIGFSQLLRKNVIVNSSVLIRRDLLDSVGSYAGSYSIRGVEDYATWLRVASFTKWHYLGTPFCNYQDSPSTSIRSDEEFPSSFGPQHAWLDLMTWRHSKVSKRSLWLSILDRLVTYLLRFALKFGQISVK